MSSRYDRGPDHYALRAKKEGYPARSVYKLEEIQNKLQLIRKGNRLLDLGASPGSWTLYALKVLRGTGSLVAVDLNPLTLRDLPRNAAFLQGDLTSPELGERLAERGPYDLVMSDAAPPTTGNRTVDSSRSYELVSAVLDLAAQLLAPGGSVVAKLFQGGDEHAVLERLRSEYGTARALKPKASRKVSFETYVIGVGKRGAENGA